jgi:hypothetical protein
MYSIKLPGEGGTLGHGINMLPREAPVEAFQRYCAEHEMKFIGLVDTQ